MNARINKEIKALLPAFTLLVCAPVLLFIEPQRAEGLVLACFVIGCAFMGATAFGHEFQQRTLPLLLTQPLPRSALWREKMLVLSAALAISTGVLGIAFRLLDRRVLDPDLQWLAFGLVPLCALSGGPFFALSCRNTLVAGFLSLLAPGSILLAVGLVVEGLFHSPYTAAVLGVVLLLVYCAVCCWIARAHFQDLQVVGSAQFSRDLVLPPRIESFLARRLRRVSARFGSPFASLVKKEFRLQQVSLLGAGVFVIGAAVGGLAYQLQTALKWEYQIAQAILGLDFALYIILLPFLAGALSIAEEKTWGVADWHLTLPPSIRKQWSIKMLAALSTSLVLGVVVPSMLAIIGGGHFPPLPLSLAFVMGYLLLTSVVMYAASLSRSTVGAILLAFGMILIAAVSTQLASLLLTHSGLITNLFWLDHITGNALSFGLCGGMLLLLCLVQWFAYLGFQRRVLSLGQLTFQALALILVVGLLTILFVI